MNHLAHHQKVFQWHQQPIRQVGERQSSLAEAQRVLEAEIAAAVSWKWRLEQSLMACDRF